MKKMFAVLLAVACLLSCSVLGVAAAENYCSVFESGIDFLSMWQSGDVKSGEKFSDYAMIQFALGYIDTASYVVKPGEPQLSIPGDIFEAEVMKHFDVDAADVRGMRWNGQPAYDGKNYCVEKMAAGSNSSGYVIRGYEKKGDRYEAYYTLVDYRYEKPANAVEGKDYLVCWRYDSDGKPVEAVYGILDSHLKVTLTYNGKNVKYLTWETVATLPALSGMTTPTRPDTSVGATTASTTATTAKNPTDSTTAGGTTAGTEKTTTAHDGGKTDGATDHTTDATQETDVGTTTERTTIKNGRVTTTERTTIKNGRVTTTANGTTSMVTTIPTLPLETVIETDEVILQASAGVFPKNVTVDITPITTGEIYTRAKRALDDIAEQFTVYEITAKSDTATVQPAGKVTATFRIPEGYEAGNTAVVYIAPGGSTEILVSRVDTAAGTVTAELSHCSTYAIAQLHTANAASGPNVLVIVACVLGAVLLLGGAVIYLNYRKKTAPPTDEDAAKETAATEE